MGKVKDTENINYQKLLLDELTVMKGYAQELLRESIEGSEDEIRNSTVNFKAVEILEDLLTARYNRDEKAFVEKPSNITDLFNAKRNLEIAMYYLEDFFFINRERNNENNAIRKACRGMHHNLCRICRQEEEQLKWNGKI